MTQYASLDAYYERYRDMAAALRAAERAFRFFDPAKQLVLIGMERDQAVRACLNQCCLWC